MSTYRGKGAAEPDSFSHRSDRPDRDDEAVLIAALESRPVVGLLCVLTPVFRPHSALTRGRGGWFGFADGLVFAYKPFSYASRGHCTIPYWSTAPRTPCLPGWGDTST